MSTLDLPTRLHEVGETLVRLALVYRMQLPNLLGLPERRHGGRTGKPTSRPPSGSDHGLRAALVAVARHLQDAADALEGYDWAVTHLGFHRIGAKHVETQYDVAIDRLAGESGEVVVPRVVWQYREVWTPVADDLSVEHPHPDLIASACGRLRSQLVQVRDNVDELDPLPAVQACNAVGRAVKALEQVGAWEPPVSDERRCKRAGCDGGDGQPRLMDARRGDVCQACSQRDYRERRRAG